MTTDIITNKNIKQRKRVEMTDRLKYTLFSTNIVCNNLEKMSFNEYVVQESDVMRIDKIVMNMYEDDLYLKDIDIILKINNIDNPLDIVNGDVLYYPPVDVLDVFRISNDNVIDVDDIIKQTIGVPDKSSKIDPNRKKFIENNYSIPPTLMKDSEEPIKINDGIVEISQG